MRVIIGKVEKETLRQRIEIIGLSSLYNGIPEFSSQFFCIFQKMMVKIHELAERMSDIYWISILIQKSPSSFLQD